MNLGLESLRRLHGDLHEASEKRKKEISKWAREKRNIIERKRVRINGVTIISNTCIGGVMCHDLGLRFDSPTVNIYIRPDDFVRFCERIHEYLQMPLSEVLYDEEIGYPVATLDDIKLYCKHYINYSEVYEAWEKRKKRIDWDNCVFIMTDRDFVPPVSINRSIQACSEETIQRFEALPFERKICIVQNQSYVKKYYSCRQLLKGCQGDCVGIITDIIGITGKRMYQYVKDFDYIHFLNGE